MSTFSNAIGTYAHNGYAYMVTDKKYYKEQYPFVTEEELNILEEAFNNFGYVFAFRSMEDITKLPKEISEFILDKHKKLELIHNQEIDMYVSIFVNSKIADLVTQDEFDAVMYHEYAHIANGDLKGDIAHTSKGMSHIDVDTYELAADAYGASMVSAKAMAYGIVKMSLRKAVVDAKDFEYLKSAYRSAKLRLEALGY